MPLKKDNHMLFGWKKCDSGLDARGRIAEEEASDAVFPCVEFAGHTDIGKQRSVNQDQFLIADMHKSMHIQCPA